MEPCLDLLDVEIVGSAAPDEQHQPQGEQSFRLHDVDALLLTIPLLHSQSK